MPIAVAQVVTGTDAAAASTSMAVTLTVSAGNSLHVCATLDSTAGADFTGISSVPSLAWSAALDDVNDATDLQRVGHWVADGTAAGSITITVTCNNTGSRAITAKEISGTSGYDSAAAAHNGQHQPTPGIAADGVSSLATPTLTTQPALISGYSMRTNGSGAPTAGTGFTSDGSGWQFGGGVDHMRTESKRLTATTGVPATFTAAANTNHCTVAAVFKETVAGGATQPMLQLLGVGA